MPPDLNKISVWPLVGRQRFSRTRSDLSLDNSLLVYDWVMQVKQQMSLYMGRFLMDFVQLRILKDHP